MYSTLVYFKGIAMNYKCNVTRYELRVLLKILEIKLKIRQIKSLEAVYFLSVNIICILVYEIFSPPSQ